MRPLFTVTGRIRLLEALRPEDRERFNICEEGFLKDGDPFSDGSMLNFLIEVGVATSNIIFCLGVPADREDEYVNVRLAVLASASVDPADVPALALGDTRRA